MRVLISILPFVITLGAFFAAAAPVSMPSSGGLQNARAPATQDATVTAETVRAPLIGAVLNLLPTLQARGGIPGSWQCPGGNAHRGCDPERNHQPYRCNDGDYSRACANPTHRPPHHTNGGPPHSLTANTAPQIGRAQKDVVVGSAQVRSELKAEHGLLGALDARGIHEGDDRDAALGNRKDNGSITAGNPNPPYQSRETIHDPPKTKGPHQSCGAYNRACKHPPMSEGALDSRSELTIHHGADRDAALGNRKGNGSLTAGNPTGGW